MTDRVRKKIERAIGRTFASMTDEYTIFHVPFDYQHYAFIAARYVEGFEYDENTGLARITKAVAKKVAEKGFS